MEILNATPWKKNPESSILLDHLRRIENTIIGSDDSSLIIFKSLSSAISKVDLVTYAVDKIPTIPILLLERVKLGIGGGMTQTQVILYNETVKLVGILADSFDPKTLLSGLNPEYFRTLKAVMSSIQKALTGRGLNSYNMYQILELEKSEGMRKSLSAIVSESSISESSQEGNIQAENLSKVYWKGKNGKVSFFKSNSSTFGVTNGEGQALSEDGYKPATYSTIRVTKEIAYYCEGFTDHYWVNIYTYDEVKDYI